MTTHRAVREADDRWARAALSHLVESGNERVVAALAADGGAATLAALRERRLGGGAAVRVRLEELDVDRLARNVATLGTRVVVPGDDEWPIRLEDLEAPPYCLYVRGAADLAEVTERSVAVVGARAATEYGLRVAWDLGEGVAGRGWTVVSGAAFGIDAAAHRGALAAEAATVAVLACGVERAYPAAHRPLLEEIRTAGAVVSEVPPGAVPLAHRFLARNRIIAALTRGTVVVEAGLRSGSLSTARTAARIHRPVGAVPGPVTSAFSAGCHELVREHGGTLVTDAAEVLDLVAPIGEHVLPGRAGEVRPTDDLDPVEAAVWEAAPLRRWSDPHRIAVGAGVAEAAVSPALAVLELMGLVERRGRQWRKTLPVRAVGDSP